MIKQLVLAVCVAVVVTLVCVLIGGILISLGVPIAVTIGGFLKTYSTVLGVISGIWFYFTGSPKPIA